MTTATIKCAGYDGCYESVLTKMRAEELCIFYDSYDFVRSQNKSLLCHHIGADVSYRPHLVCGFNVQEFRVVNSALY